MTTLIIDTSHERSLVAFANGFDLLLTLPLPFGLQSSSHLFPLIKSGFQKLKLRPADLEKVAVSVGPGSFTGIRVGVAAAKGLAAPHKLPLIRLCSLYGFIEEEGRGAAMIDARSGGAFVLLPGSEPKLVSQEELPAYLEGVERIVGPHLRRFSFSQKTEKYPDPIQLIKNALPDKDSNNEKGVFDLLYLKTNHDLNYPSL